MLLQVLNIVRAEAGCAHALPKYHREDELNQCLCYFVLFIFFISFVQKLLLGSYVRWSATSGFDSSCGFKAVCILYASDKWS